MSTRASVQVTNYNGKSYPFSIHMDGYPAGVIPDLPDESIDFEDFRRLMHLEDFFESMPDYYYEFSLQESMVSVYGHEYGKDKKWCRGALLFSGTFAEAKKKYQS